MKNDMIHAERGFALLFAVLTASVLLSVGLSIFNLTVKELILSSAGRESQFAFYAADTGAECALYWDFKGVDIFATSTDANAPVPSNPDCVGQAINITPTTRTGTSATTQFSINIPNVSPTDCSIVTVTKTASGGIISTTVDSRGYNTQCSDTSNPNRLERGLHIAY